MRATEDKLADVGLVVLDEVHYLGDPDRGSVWEEVIINCPTHIQMLCLSATVANPNDLGGWISEAGACPISPHTPPPPPSGQHVGRRYIHAHHVHLSSWAFSIALLEPQIGLRTTLSLS